MGHGLINEFSLHKPMGLNYHFVYKPMGLISSKYEVLKHLINVYQVVNYRSPLGFGEKA
jgi:hypothetical protein